MNTMDESNKQKTFADLISFASHDIKNPLASQRLLIELLISKPEQKPDEMKEMLEDILDANKKADELLTEFVTSARKEKEVLATHLKNQD